MVARFSPPSLHLARPGRLRIRHVGATLRVSWTRVSEATAYEVVATTKGSGQRLRRTAKRSLTLRGIARSTSGRVTVRAVDSVRRSVPAGARFRATARRATRFRHLPRAPKLR